MKLLSSAAQPTLSCSASLPGVRVSLRKSLLLEAMTSYFYPLHLVCGLMGLCCYAGGEQWNSLDDDFWAHMRRQGGGKQGKQREPRSMDQKARFALGEMLPIGRLFSCRLPLAPGGRGQSRSIAGLWLMSTVFLHFPACCPVGVQEWERQGVWGLMLSLTNAFRGWAGKGSSCTHRLLELFCVTVLDWNRSPGFEGAWEEGLSCKSFWSSKDLLSASSSGVSLQGR